MNINLWFAASTNVRAAILENESISSLMLWAVVVHYRFYQSYAWTVFCAKLWLSTIIWIVINYQRRVENIRRVRFAEEVTFVPPLVLSDDDGDADDEDYGQNVTDDNDDGGEELPSRPSAPRWIEALRSKTKTKPKLKLPRMRTKKYRFVWHSKNYKHYLLLNNTVIPTYFCNKLCKENFIAIHSKVIMTSKVRSICIYICVCESKVRYNLVRYKFI